jgi:hypothetical protein
VSRPPQAGFDVVQAFPESHLRKGHREKLIAPEKLRLARGIG